MLNKVKKLTLKQSELPLNRISHMKKILDQCQLHPVSSRDVILRSKAFIAFGEQKKIVGWGLLEPVNNDYLISIYIDPDCRKNNIGTKIANVILSHGKRYKKSLICNGWNFQANSFYSKIGFTKIETTNPDFRKYMKFKF